MKLFLSILLVCFSALSLVACDNGCVSVNYSDRQERVVVKDTSQDSNTSDCCTDFCNCVCGCPCCPVSVFTSDNSLFIVSIFRQITKSTSLYIDGVLQEVTHSLLEPPQV